MHLASVWRGIHGVAETSPFLASAGVSRLPAAGWQVRVSVLVLLIAHHFKGWQRRSSSRFILPVRSVLEHARSSRRISHLTAHTGLYTCRKSLPPSPTVMYYDHRTRQAEAKGWNHPLFHLFVHWKNVFPVFHLDFYSHNHYIHIQLASLLISL